MVKDLTQQAFVEDWGFSFGSAGAQSNRNTTLTWHYTVFTQKCKSEFAKMQIGGPRLLSSNPLSRQSGCNPFHTRINMMIPPSNNSFPLFAIINSPLQGPSQPAESSRIQRTKASSPAAERKALLLCPSEAICPAALRAESERRTANGVPLIGWF